MIGPEVINYVLAILALISAIWGFRANMRAYKAENDKDIEQRTLVEQRLSTLEKFKEDFLVRVTSLEDDRHELKILSNKVESIYKELDKKVDNLISMLIKRGT